ncbi:MAG: SEL1-like repeat protein [Candidatus Methanomethylophilaceae archaeon]|nr:SEL1-like repeat protein [Candidatus Methanomethylophilaceae archaeon]
MKDTKNAIEVEGISKKFDIKYTTFYGGQAKSGVKTVLDGLSFSIKKGEVMGIVGRNGSGKSTLMKILSGIMGPDSGTVNVSGKVASILELGMGFEPEMTGRDNIRIKCSMYGFTEKEINQQMESIIQFSELGEQVDHPLRTYSSGMAAKLAFSVIMHTQCNVMIVDEVLSVGDASFNAKCRMVFQKMKKEGRAILIASHSMETLESMCDRVMWIEEGKVKEIGNPSTVCYHFHSDMVDSFDTIIKLAEEGDVISMNRAAVMLRDGIGAQKDEKRAVELFTKAASMGHTDSQMDLADMKLKAGKKDEAMNLYKKAASNGSFGAITRLTLMDKDNVAISEKLMKDVRDKAESGNIRAMKLLADMLYSGNVFVKDQVEAFKWNMKCAELGNVQALYMVGFCYREGIGVEKNGEEALKWLIQAFEHGSTKARTEIANMYRKGMAIECDMSKAIEWYKLAAECGDGTAMQQLGLIYRDAIGVDKDEAQAVYWLKRQAIQSMLGAEATFGDILRQGYVDDEQKKSLYWYKDAASKGNMSGMIQLGVAYRDGGIAVADSAEASKWFSKCADLRSNLACYELALLYLRGNGVQRDTKKAFELMKMSSDLGNVNAMLQLAIMYKDGEVVQKNIPEARRLLKILSENNNNTARAILAMLPSQ